MTAAAVDYDTELVRYDPVLRRAWAVRPTDRVLDIGCGAGSTTRAAARLATAGTALGVDVSAGAVDRARELTPADGPSNVTFERADAATHPFPAGAFDLAISRFGTMFFADPVAAFTNVARALRPAGRLVMAVWQAGDRNEWDVAIRAALTGPDGPPVPTGGLDPFSLGDPATVDRTLRAAGFTAVELTAVEEPVHYGPDVPAALSWVRGFSATAEHLARLDPAGTAAALARLRTVLADHLGDRGVRFDARAWLVSATRR